MEVTKKYLDEHLNRTLTPRSTVAIISVISLAASFADFVTDRFLPHRGYCVVHNTKLIGLRANIYCLRNLLLKLFQVANLVLLLGCTVEDSSMLQLYIWYTLSFVVFGFVMTIAEFLTRIKTEHIWSFLALFADVTYLFVIFWCLPIIDAYRKSLGCKTEMLERKSSSTVI